MSIREIRRSEAPRTCSKTGFALIPAAGRTVYRLSKPVYGPLNPLLRPLSETATHALWNRFDVAGQRTVYAATTPEGAYGELLAPLKPKLPRSAATYFDDVTPHDELETLIREEWQAAGHRAPREIDLTWLTDYLLYRLTLPTKGWFIDIEAATSLTALTTYAPTNLPPSITEITVSELRSPNRDLTTAIATRLWHLTLDDQSLAHGIIYGSRHGSDWDCWAIWLRRTTRAPRALVTRADKGTEILPP
ncbi:hypothetical protein ACFYTQ_09770 [Nocardia sp. NPDC004068]|uniref:hypothetical protein n=1 Tax=Nocardia sp. NPDC004068 TaxID=3364303 RepID=UPI00367BF41C